MIEIQGLTRRYGATVAVDDVSLSIRRGEITGLLGHNGAGKTTLMKMLTGYLEPSAGTVTIAGEDVVTARAATQRLVGYLPESAPLYPEMLVQEYLLMMAELRGLSGAEAERAAGEAASACGLRDRLLQPIGTLSKGFRQRVGIAQAILHRPAVLVLDEPTNGLDPMQIQQIRELIRRLGRDSTILLSTHILQEIEAVCERVLVMIDGRLVADAPMAELLRGDAATLSLRGGTQVEAALRGVQGVIGVSRAGPDPALAGFERYHVRAGGPPPLPALVAAALAAGAEVGAAAPEVRTLERVFQELQDAELRRRQQKEAS